MGERLLVSVIEEQERICAVYYQWSAYSIPALYVLKELLEFIQDKDSGIADPRLRIIRGVEQLGGLLDKEDLHLARKIWPDEQFSISDHASNSNGLVCISEETMAKAESFIQGTATINLDLSRATNGCFNWYESLDELLQEMRDCDEEEEEIEKYRTAMPASCYNQVDVAFSDIDATLNELEDLSTKTFYFRNTDGSILSIIDG